ncbi:MAG: DUF4153 domain-containing protein [Bacteroidetes bacterium]|nr:DUF4153 domain-containing protein [Bacteroidota bacterium]
MKLPSLGLLVQQAKETFMRFPLVLISALIGSFSMMYVIGFSRDYYEIHSQLWYNIVMTCSLGIPLFIAFALFFESRKHTTAVKYVYQIIPAAALLLFFFSLSKETDFFDIGRYLLYLTAFHLLVSFSSYLFKGKDQIGFWDFNQTVFLRFVLSALYSGVLYAGLAIALLAFDKLFDMHIKGERYGQLFFFIAGVFNTWFFCSGVPAVDGSGDTEFRYPKGLKIFAQYVLLPIVVVYVVILYMYLFKIIFQWSLPMGWVSYLVLGFSGAGIFSILLVYLLMDNVKWMRVFSKLFFASLIPQIVLLFLAISRRTAEYGITERRYYVIVLAAWLAVTTIYYLITNFKNIKYIPVSLCIIALATSAGPWSAFSLSLNSQLSRLEEVLKKNSILVDGKIVKNDNGIPDNEMSDVRSILEYLIQRRKLEKIQPWFSENLAEVTADKTREFRRSDYYKLQGIMDLMGLKGAKQQEFRNKKYINVVTKDMKVLDVEKFGRLLFYESYPQDTIVKKFGKDSVMVSFDRALNTMSVSSGNDSLKFDINPALKSLDTETPEKQSMTIDNETGRLRARLLIKSFDAEKQSDSIKINGLQAYILMRLNE